MSASLEGLKCQPTQIRWSLSILDIVRLMMDFRDFLYCYEALIDFPVDYAPYITVQRIQVWWAICLGWGDRSDCNSSNLVSSWHYETTLSCWWVYGLPLIPLSIQGLTKLSNEQQWPLSPEKKIEEAWHLPHCSRPPEPSQFPETLCAWRLERP